MQLTRLAAAPLILLAAAFVPGTAGAGGPVTYWEATNGAGACQGALPAFAGTLRARPLAIQNEGDATAFVTCSLDAGDGTYSKSIPRVVVSVRNNSAATVEIPCTMVDGWGSYAQYLTRTVTVTANSTWAFAFTSSELPGAPAKFSMPNLSCQLPPQTGVQWVGHDYRWD